MLVQSLVITDRNADCWTDIALAYGDRLQVDRALFLKAARQISTRTFHSIFSYGYQQ
jgi:hypothetical protein